MTGEEILKSHVACLLTYKSRVQQLLLFQTVDDGKLFPLIWKEISIASRNSLTAPCFQKTRLENVVSSFHHQEIPRRNSICSVTAWPFMRSKNCLSFFFQEDTSRKFLILLLSYFPVFWLQISFAFAIIFADCHGLSCVHVRASSYTGLFRVSLGGVGLRCVGLAQKISARCNTGSYVCSFFFICIFFLCLALSHIYISYSLSAFPQIWK